MAKSSRITLILITLFLSSMLLQPAWQTSAQPAGSRPSHGAISGDVTSTTAVIWSRNAARQRAVMNVEVSTSPGFPADSTRMGGATWVDTGTDYIGQLVVGGLRAGTTYYYRVWFDDNKSASATGRFATAPGLTDQTDVSFAWVSDLGGQGACRTTAPDFAGYPILDAVARVEMQFLVFLGDQIYVDNACPDKSPIRELPQLPAPAVARGNRTQQQNLEILRQRWAYNRAEPKFQRILSQTSMYAAWDDHEIINDWGGKELSGLTPSPLVPPDPGLYLAGQKAFFEWNPIATTPHEPVRVYRKFRWGQTADLFFLDERTYRDRNDMRDGPGKSMLGAAQLAWLKDGLVESNARWKIIFTSVPLSIPTGFPARNGRDGWAAFPDPAAPGVEFTGFENELRDILRFIRDRNIRNVIWLTADVHFAEVIRYRPDLDGDGRPDLEFYEIANGPLSAIGAPPPPQAGHSQTFRPEILFAYGPRTFVVDPAFFNFGVARINGRTGEFTIELRDINGAAKFTLTIPAQ